MLWYALIIAVPLLLGRAFLEKQKGESQKAKRDLLISIVIAVLIGGCALAGSFSQ